MNIIITYFFIMLVAMIFKETSAIGGAYGVPTSEALLELQEPILLNVSVVMLNRRTALLQWWPRDALINKEVEIVFTPEYSNYKVVVGLVDPVGNTVELHDLKPYTYYQLDLRDRNGQKLYASLNFSTAVLDSKLALMYQPTGGFPPGAVRPAEVGIVAIVLFVWASAVYVFFNQWGKIRHLIPYQPQYKYQESIEDGEANISQCHHCDTQIRQVHTFDELFTLNARREQLRYQLLKGRLNNSSIYLGPRRSCFDDSDWWADISQNTLRKTKSAEHLGMAPTIIVNSSISEESCDGKEDKEENLLPSDQKSSKDFLNPPPSSDFYGMTKSPSRAEVLPVNVLPVIGKAKMVEASKNVFLKAIREKKAIQHPSNIAAASGVPVVLATASTAPVVQPLKSRFPKRQPSSANPALVELMENSIPQTTTLFNRMYKRGAASGSTGNGASGARKKLALSIDASDYCTETIEELFANAAEEQPTIYINTRIIGKGRSTESTESGNSRHNLEFQNFASVGGAPSLLNTSSESTKQRVGSFRSRLKKQQPIMMSEPPLGSPNEQVQQLVTMNSASVDNPYVSVTVHSDNVGKFCDL